LEIEVESRFLITVLNAITGPNGKIVVKAPLFDLNLVEFNYSDLSSARVVGKAEYFMGLNTVRLRIKKSEVFDREVPGYDDFRDALLSSGVIKPPNIEDVRERILREYRLRAENPIEYPRPIVLAVDTNVLFYRIVSNFLNDIPYRLTFAVSECVKREIARKANLRVRDLSELRRGLSFRGLGTTRYVYDGILSLAARKALIALAELEYVKSNHMTYECSCEGIGDRVIAKSYRDFMRENGVEVVVLTSDYRMRTYTSTVGLRSLFLKTPQEIDVKLTYRNLAKLIYTLSTYYITLKLYSGLRWVEVRGVYPGKTMERWVEEKVVVSSPNRGIMEKIKKYVNKVHAVENVLRKI